MRLVDADKLYPDCMTKDGKLAISQSQLANAPTVTPKQGEWIALYENDGTPIGYKCPYCDDEPQIINTNFCPNCGADMRKGGAE